MTDKELEAIKLTFIHRTLVGVESVNDDLRLIFNSSPGDDRDDADDIMLIARPSDYDHLVVEKHQKVIDYRWALAERLT